ncbi:AAA family ATPase [Bradyrhizobium sp. CB1015]|uniref:DNA polymerase III subunit n=1 Tax=Bradyrhizobium sp. CB1015 TaxID=2976822 RepID=UPI0021AAE2C4|nr:AAA family ATPase [Bradyrhizobium sp. CB1015]UWU92938.1 AAA family ATPase [Bradyrhizobium sp. CB1015]
MVDVSAILDRCRLRRFDDVLGQDGILESLQEKIDCGRDEPLLPHLVFTGRSGVGKRSLARLYAQMLLCEKAGEGAPCHKCNECRGVSIGSSFSYVEFSALQFPDERYFRQRVEQTKMGMKGTVWRVFLIDDAEWLGAASTDVMLKTLEKRLDSVFIFVVNDIARFPRALRSRCQVFRLTPVEHQALVSRLKAVCNRESLIYEERALSVIALAAGGQVGEALTKLAEVASLGGVTLAGARRTLNLEWGEAMIQCWLAQLRGQLDEALSHFERVASDDEGRVRAMQSFVLAVHFRSSVGALPFGISPALECLADEAWLPILEEWENLSQRRSAPLTLLIEDAMKFWGGVNRLTPSRASFHQGYERLFGAQKDMAGLEKVAT